MKRALVATVAALAVLAAAAPASAKWYGSTLSGKPNVNYGCETALTMGPLGGAQLSPTGRRSCTYQHVGYLNNLRRPGSVVPPPRPVRSSSTGPGPSGRAGAPVARYQPGQREGRAMIVAQGPKPL